MNPIESMLMVTLGACSLMVGLWVIQYRQRNATIVDVGWSFGLLVTICFLAVSGQGDAYRRILLLLLAGSWSARLTWHIVKDRVFRKWRIEDGRYARMRQAMGKWNQIGFLIFFQVQAGFIVLFFLPMIPVATNTRPLGYIDLLGVVIGIIAITGEGISDRQLAAFRNNPKNANRTCREGMWRYSRHPNYFFECVHWFVYIPLAYGHSLWYLTVLGPFAMYGFIMFVTGVPHTEQQAASHRPDYLAYQKSTNALIPWFPRRMS